MTPFCSRLRSAREAAGLNQTQLGTLMRRTQASISRLESGQREPRWWELLLFERILGLPVAEMAVLYADSLPDPTVTRALPQSAVAA